MTRPTDSSFQRRFTDDFAIGLRTLRSRLGRPVDVASLAVFRILLGGVLFFAVARYASKGWIEKLLLAPAYHFTYAPFSFVKPWPGIGMYIHYGCLALLALGIAMGYRHRMCAALFFFGICYVELIDKALYLNHYYLVSLLVGLLALLPASGVFSLDARLRPELRIATVPAWVLFVLRLQVGLVYFYAGLAKLNADWLLQAQPLRIWLLARSDLPIVGPLFTLPATAFAASWFGAAFDLSAPLLLLWRRTRALGALAVVVFHLLTAILFPIGIFPWLMILSATLFFPPSWPRHALRLLQPNLRPPLATDPRAWKPPRWLAPVLALHCMVQVLLPLREHLTSGSSAWTVQGFNFAWKVMVAEKTGTVSFRARDRNSGETLRIDPNRFFAPFQVIAMAQDPEMVLQAARVVEEHFRTRGKSVAVYADAVASLNGHPSKPLLDPRVDLTGPLPETWILPLE